VEEVKGWRDGEREGKIEKAVEEKTL